LNQTLKHSAEQDWIQCVYLGAGFLAVLLNRLPAHLGRRLTCHVLTCRPTVEGVLACGEKVELLAQLQRRHRARPVRFEQAALLDGNLLNRLRGLAGVRHLALPNPPVLLLLLVQMFKDERRI
jgi:hypothetical protein